MRQPFKSNEMCGHVLYGPWERSVCGVLHLSFRGDKERSTLCIVRHSGQAKMKKRMRVSLTVFAPSTASPDQDHSKLRILLID
jgi:hypothetical protein